MPKDAIIPAIILLEDAHPAPTAAQAITAAETAVEIPVITAATVETILQNALQANSNASAMNLITATAAVRGSMIPAVNMVATIQQENAMIAIPLDALLGNTGALETYQCTVTKAGFGLRMNPAIMVVILQQENANQQNVPQANTNAQMTIQCIATMVFGKSVNTAITVVIRQRESVQRIPDQDVLLASTNVPVITP